MTTSSLAALMRAHLESRGVYLPDPEVLELAVFVQDVTGAADDEPTREISQDLLANLQAASRVTS